MPKIQSRQKKQKLAVIVFNLIGILAISSGVYLWYRYAAKPPPDPMATLGPYLVVGLGIFAVVLTLLLEPVGVDVKPGEVVLRTRWGVKKIRGFRVLGRFTTGELLRYAYFCPVGWRLDTWSLYAICSTAFGRAVAFSTPACSDKWLALEAGGRRYVICCEEKDGHLCDNV
jgi:hypothetical protein